MFCIDPSPHRFDLRTECRSFDGLRLHSYPRNSVRENNSLFLNIDCYLINKRCLCLTTSTLAKQVICIFKSSVAFRIDRLMAFSNRCSILVKRNDTGKSVEFTRLQWYGLQLFPSLSLGPWVELYWVEDACNEEKPSPLNNWNPGLLKPILYVVRAYANTRKTHVSCSSP